MKIIENLISRYCPDGVEYVDLGEVVVFTDGHSFSSGSFTESGEYQVVKITDIFGGLVNRGKTFINELPEKLKNGQQLSGGEILVAMSGSTGKTGYNTLSNAVVNQRIAILRNQDCIENGYLKHLLVNGTFETYCFKNGTGPQNNISKAQLLRYRVPLPPLPIQQEIVRILDTFTNLTAELTAELTARRKQYEYYRDELLTFDRDRNEVVWYPLGEICNVVSGGTPSKKTSSYWENGTIKWLGSTVCKNEKTVDEVTKYITLEGLNSSSAKLMPIGTTLIALVGATIGKVAYLPFEAAINQNIAGICPKDTKSVDSSYLYYACTRLYQEFLSLTQGQKLAMANLSFVRSLKIPVPPIDEQKRIAEVLDKFNAICSDLRVGLPAEITARQKQYEYYRDRLFIF